MSTKITPGAIRFNTDSMKLEYYHLGSAGIGTLAAGEWVQITTDTPDIQTGGTRGLSAANNTGDSNISYFSFSTAGGTIDFGDLNASRTNGTLGCASRTRAIFGGGNGQPTTEFVTIASTGNGTSFGNLVNDAREGIRALSNQTRGI